MSRSIHQPFATPVDHTKRTADNITRISQTSELCLFINSLNNELCGLLLRTLLDTSEAIFPILTEQTNDATADVARNVDVIARNGQLNFLVTQISNTAREALQTALVTKAQTDVYFKNNAAFQQHLSTHPTYTTTDAALDFLFLPTYSHGCYCHQYSSCGYYSNHHHHHYYNNGYYGDGCYNNNNGTFAGIEALANGVVNGLASVANHAVNNAETVATVAMNVGEQVAGTAATGIGAAAPVAETVAAETATSVFDSVYGFFGSVATTVSGVASAAASTAADAASSAYNAAQGIELPDPSGCCDTFGDCFSGCGDCLGSLLDGLK